MRDWTIRPEEEINRMVDEGCPNHHEDISEEKASIVILDDGTEVIIYKGGRE